MSKLFDHPFFTETATPKPDIDNVFANRARVVKGGRTADLVEGTTSNNFHTSPRHVALTVLGPAEKRMKY
jgi:hypothetical protein